MKSLSFRQLFSILFLLFVGFLAATALQAWTGPTATAPGNNVSAPINVGTSDQVKNAGLSINSLYVSGSALIQSKVGINLPITNPATLPVVALDVNGTLRLGNGGESCSAVTAGGVRYNATSNALEYCNGTAWTVATGGGDKLSAIRTYTTRGTWSKPSNLDYITVELYGGGGGGGGSGGSGEAAGGTGGAAGGDTSFGTLAISTGGGGGGGGGALYAGGNGASDLTAQANARGFGGGGGGDGAWNPGGGNGGNSGTFGGVGGAGANVAGNPANGAGGGGAGGEPTSRGTYGVGGAGGNNGPYGAGGSGGNGPASGYNFAGGAGGGGGAGGHATVYFAASQLGGSVNYTVGTGGGAGTAGSGGTNGSAGSGGAVIVYEFTSQ